MLSASKLHLVAGLKVHGLDLRKAELDFFMLRYTQVAGISSVLTGLSYVSVIKIKVPEYMRPEEEYFAWQVFFFYAFAAATMCTSLFNMLLTSFLVVNAQGMCLRGPPNAVTISVEILGTHWSLSRAMLVLSILLLLSSTAMIIWMKLDESEWNPSPAVICTSLIVGVFTMAGLRMARLARELAIPADAMVRGDLRIDSQVQGPAHSKVDLLHEGETAAESVRGG